MSFLIGKNGLRVWGSRVRVCDSNSGRINTERKNEILRKIKKYPICSYQENSPKQKMGYFLL